MAVFLGLDVHRAQITFHVLDLESGEIQTGRVRAGQPRDGPSVLGRFDARQLVAGVEAMTGWRFIAPRERQSPEPLRSPERT